MRRAPDTLDRVPRRRKDPAEVSRIRAEAGRRAWAGLTPEQRSERAKVAAANRPRLTRVQLRSIIEDTLAPILDRYPSDADLDRLVERLRAAGVWIEEERATT